MSAGVVWSDPEVPSASETKQAPRYSSQPIIEEIRGILLIPSQEYVNYCDIRYVRKLETHDLCVPGGLDSLREVLEPIFVDQPLTQELLTCLKEEIVIYYRNHNHPVVSVYVPEQEVTDGVLQVVIMEGSVGQIATSGNRWFFSWIIESFLRLGPGDVITADTLLTDIAWLNRNPFRNVDVVFTPGCDPGTTNIELLVCDRCPLQFYIGGDNTGTGLSGTDRYFVGGTWGNALFLDHIATYQYTTSRDFNEFQSHTFHYTAPLWWHHILLFFGGYSTVKPDIQDFDGRGKFFQSSVRYVVPFLCNYNGNLLEWSIGFDYKNYNNNLEFTSDVDLAIITKSVNLSQFMMGLSWGCENECHRFSLNADIYGSPGKLLPKESTKRYDNLSPESSAKYIYGKLTVGETVNLLWCWSFAALARLQLSSENLLPSERFGIGGYDTVRGYQEREFNADNALVANAELRTPPMSVLRFFGYDNCCDEMLFLFFFDYGIGSLIDREIFPQGFQTVGPKIGKTEYLMSIGPGWRYTINRYLAVRVDLGFKLHRSIFSDSSRSRWHFGLVLSY